MLPIQEALRDLEMLDFGGKGEAFVESRFLTPLLQCLGYEAGPYPEAIVHCQLRPKTRGGTRVMLFSTLPGQYSVCNRRDYQLVLLLLELC